jgi:integrase
MSVATRGSKFQARIKEPKGGKYHRETFDTLEAAQFWEGKAREAIKAGLPVPNTNDRGTVTYRSLAERYGAYLWPNQRPKMIETDIRHAMRLLPSDPLKLTTKEVIRFVEKRKREGVVDITIKGNLTRVKTLLKHSHVMGDVHLSDTIEWPTFKKGQSRIRYLTVEEETALLSALEITDYRMLSTFLIDTGCRPSEVVPTVAVISQPFEWNDVSKSKDGRTLITLWKTKTNTPRTIPLTQRALEALEWSREEGHSRPFDGINYVAFRDYVANKSNNLGFKAVVVYTFRHTCASRLVQRGADILRVKTWMGHSNIETTLGYAKLAPEDIYSLSDLL